MRGRRHEERVGLNRIVLAFAGQCFVSEERH